MAITTLCGVKICGTILGVKKCLSIDMNSPDYGLFEENIAQTDSPICAIFHIKSSIFTSNNKISHQIQAFLKHSSGKKANEYILHFDGFTSQKRQSEVIEMFLKEQIPDDNFNIEVDSYDFGQMFVRNKLNIKNFFILANVKNARDYEKDFRNFAEINGTAVIFDIESATKGHLSLCKKFGLESYLSGVRHDRHIEKAQDLNPDGIIFDGAIENQLVLFDQL